MRDNIQRDRVHDGFRETARKLSMATFVLVLFLIEPRDDGVFYGSCASDTLWDAFLHIIEHSFSESTQYYSCATTRSFCSVAHVFRFLSGRCRTTAMKQPSEIAATRS